MICWMVLDDINGIEYELDARYDNFQDAGQTGIEHGAQIELIILIGIVDGGRIRGVGQTTHRRDLVVR